MRTARSMVQVSKKYLAYDNFNRADGPIGTSTSGHVWIDSGGVWEIVSNIARLNSDTNGGLTVVTLPGFDYVVLAKIPAVATYVEVIARCSSFTGFYVAAYNGTAGGAILLRNSVTLATAGGSFAPGDVLGLAVKGPRIRVLRNGVAVISVTDYGLGPGTGVGAGLRNGIGSAVGTKTYDDFRVIYPI